MNSLSVRELRKSGRRVLERVARGESFTVTIDGHPVAELRPLRRRALSATTLLAHWRRLPNVDRAGLQGDIERTMDTSIG